MQKKAICKPCTMKFLCRIEYAHYKAAISKRNRWMVDQVDCLISYIICQYGGAYQTYRYAQRKSIPIINVAKEAPQCLK